MLETLATLLGGGALAALIRWGYAWWRARHSFAGLLERIDVVNTSLRQLVDKTGAMRAGIFTGHNGGGVPRLGNHVKTSMLYEATAAYQHSMKQGWQDILMEADQTKYLLSVFNDYQATVILDNLSPSNLQDAYITNGIKMGKWFFISQDKERWYYLVLHYDNVAKLTPQMRDLTREEVTKLRKLFKGEK